MPTYEFRCKKCKNTFDVFTSISGKDKVKCPKCKSASVEQIFTTVQIKGGKGGSSCTTCNTSSCSTCSTGK